MVVVGLLSLVDEEAVAALAGSELQRQRDQVAESSVGHGVLVGEQPVVGLQPELMSPLHGFREQVAAHAAGFAGWDRLGEEEPGVRAVARAGPLDGDGHLLAAAGLGERRDVLLPRALVEIGRQEPTGLIGQHRVHADDVPALQVMADHLVCHGQQVTVRALTALHPPLVAQACDPFVGAGGCVSLAAGLLALPQLGVDVLPPTEEASEKRNLVARRGGRSGVLGPRFSDRGGLARLRQSTLSLRKIIPEANECLLGSRLVRNFSITPGNS